MKFFILALSLLFMVSCGGGRLEINKISNRCDSDPSKKHDIIWSIKSLENLTSAIQSFDIETAEALKLNKGIPYFVPYDLKSGMSYVYGVDVADYMCNGSEQVSFFDSYSKNRSDFSSEVSVSGYISYFQNSIGVILDEFSKKDNFLDVWPKLKTDTLLLERGVSVDLNGDGFIDVVRVGNFPGGVFSYINPGESGASWIKKVINLDSVKGPVNIVSLDLNKDGIPDFAVSGRKSVTGNPLGKGMLAILLSQASDATWKTIILPQADYLGDIRALNMADFDEDGKVDLVFSDMGSGKLYIINDVLNPFSSIMVLSPDISMYQAHYGQIINLENSKKIILLPSYMSINVVAHENEGWQVKKVISLLPNSSSLTVTDVKAVDIDADDFVEIFFAVSSSAPFESNAQKGGIYMYKPNVGIYKIIQEAAYIAMFDFIDFNRDGKLDIVYNAEYPRNSVSVLINQSYRQ